MLHWANKDQYYTKSGENFSNYSFKLKTAARCISVSPPPTPPKDNRKGQRQGNVDLPW